MQSGVRKIDPYHNFIYRNLDCTIVLTDRMKGMLSETTILPSKRIFVFPYGVEHEIFDSISTEKQELRAYFGFPLDKYLIECVGRIEHREVQLVLVDALVKGNLSNFALLLVGKIDEKGNFAKKSKKKVVKNGLSNSFIYNDFTRKSQR